MPAFLFVGICWKNNRIGQGKPRGKQQKTTHQTIDKPHNQAYNKYKSVELCQFLTQIRQNKQFQSKCKLDLGPGCKSDRSLLEIEVL